MSKLNKLSIKAFLKGKMFLQECKEELKNDERGLSGVVVAVLLILVAVLAIVLLWGFLKDWLQELWEKITGEANKL